MKPPAALYGCALFCKSQAASDIPARLFDWVDCTGLFLRLGPFTIFFVEPGVAAGEVDFFTGNPHLFNLRGDFENVAVGNEQRRLLARLNGAQAIRHTERLGGEQGQSLVGNVCWQPVRCALGCPA